MKTVYYFAAWTDSGCLLGCDHRHQTVTSAVACINVAGGYVVAVETQMRELTKAEEAEFQLANYGIGDSSRLTKTSPKRAFDWLPAEN